MNTLSTARKESAAAALRDPLKTRDFHSTAPREIPVSQQQERSDELVDISVNPLWMITVGLAAFVILVFAFG